METIKTQTISDKKLLELLDRCEVLVELGVSCINYDEDDYKLSTTLRVNDCEFDCEVWGEEDELELTENQLNVIEAYLERAYLRETESYISKDFKRLDGFLKSLNRGKVVRVQKLNLVG
ncbi:hypothetical protein [Tenacibaculum sp. 190524A02b]|uniref:hypothetical protein n=1 Tax=Tenacibaculum vairaonense TaxID=3137860 RepID=UPI0031FB0B64